MVYFDSLFSEKMKENGYKETLRIDWISHEWMTFQNGYDDLSKDMFHVCYLRAEMSTEAIRIAFSSHHDEHVLFVVDVRAIPTYEHVSELPTWIKALHAIYYGRIYVYNDLRDTLSACHFDWSADTRRYSEPLDLDGILFTDTDCKLRDFPGVFHIARFYDKAFWKDAHTNTDWKQEQQETPEQKKKRTKWDEFDKRQKKRGGTPYEESDVFEAFRKAFEEQMRRAQQSQDYANNWYKQPRSNPSPVDDKWLQEFIATGSLEAAKTLYRQLGKSWHPDLNPGKPLAHETMTAINIAYDKVKDILR